MKPYGPEQIIARAMAAHEQGDPEAAATMSLALARHFNVPFSDEIVAAIDANKLTLSRGVKSFTMTPHLISKQSLAIVVGELMKPLPEENNGSTNPTLTSH